MKPSPFVRTLVVTTTASVMALIGSAGERSAAVSAPAHATAGPGQFERLPETFYGTAAIPPGFDFAVVVNRFITKSSRVFLTVDTTAAYDEIAPLPGLKVVDLADGRFTAKTVDETTAPISGVPFTYVVVNGPQFGTTVVGTAAIRSGDPSVVVPAPGVTAAARVVVSMDLSGLDGDRLKRSGLRVVAVHSGSFEVGTIDASTVPSETRFHWMANGDADCVAACSARIAARFDNHIQPVAGLSSNSGVLVTPRGGANIKIHTHGAGFFQVATLSLQTVASDLPFDYFVFQPPAQWEEFGPTAWSGNAWTVAADPSAPDTWYAGSLSGVWKTTNAGDTWYRAWNLRTTSIARLAMTLRSPSQLWAMALDGSTYRSQNSGETWTAVAAVTAASGIGSSAGLVSPRTGLVYACHRRGLYRFDAGAGGAWQSAAPPGAGTDCSDVVQAPDGRLIAAFRAQFDSTTKQVLGGIFIRGAAEGDAWKQVMPPLQRPAVDSPDCSLKGGPCDARPVRVAANGDTLVANIDCYMFVAPLRNLITASGGLPILATLWKQAPGSTGTSLISYPWKLDPSHHVCGGVQNGYAMSIGISPADSKLIFALGTVGSISEDGGLTWRAAGLAKDEHEIRFVSRQLVLVADDTHYVEMSTDAGRSWTSARTNGAHTFGPPITEFYDITVSQPDPFGRVLIGGNVQDLGGTFMLGRPAGFSCCGGEYGLTVAAQHLDVLTSTQTLGGRTVPVRVTRGAAYGTAASVPAVLISCRFDVTGPDYGPPGTKPFWDGAAINATCRNGAALPMNITALGTSRQNARGLLVGLADGSLYRPDPQDIDPTDADGLRLQSIRPPSNDTITAIFFVSDTDAYIGSQRGAVVRVHDPFGSPSFTTLTPPPFAQPVASFAAVYGDAGSDLYVATPSNVWLTRTATSGDPTWIGLAGTGTDPVASNLSSGTEIVGVVRDEGSPAVYLATGHSHQRPAGNWQSYGISNGSVFRAMHPAAGAAFGGWTRFTEGMPTVTDPRSPLSVPAGLPITGIGLSANRALFVSTQGYGVWWRRDVGRNTAAVPSPPGAHGSR